jgi:membrane-bound lytic murein transglycosylase D
MMSLTSSGENLPDVDSPQENTEDVMPNMPDSLPMTQMGPKWGPTDYSKQTSALGWSPDAFKVPAGMEERVQFWKDIYTKYTSDQGVLHDSLYVGIVYDTLDFSDITSNTEWTNRERERARRKRVKERKKEIETILHRLQTLKDGSGLEGESRRIWDMFQKVDEPRKFLEASRRGRLRFQLGQRTQFIAGIKQSGRYLRQMEEIFQQEGMPLELTRLPFVESSFNLGARSKVGASGIWQFMRSAAKPYMRMDLTADERNDPLRATRSAAKKMRENYQMLKLWPLAITAYNHGPSGVLRLTQKMGTTDIVELLDVRHGRFGFASANFFASFLAALDVEKNADKHFGAIEIFPELRGAEVQLMKSQPVRDLLKYFDGNLELAKQYNPHVTESVWRGKLQLSRKQILRVPLKLESQAKNDLQ